MKKLIHILLTSIIAMIMACCAGNTYHLVIEDLVPNVDKETIKQQIAFYASVAKGGNESYNTRGIYTPDTIKLPKGRVIHMFLYSDYDTPITATPIGFYIYVATEDGVIEPQQPMYKISLKPGTYSLYAISEFNNASDKTPPFVNGSESGGLMNGLYNGLDYLWWSRQGFVITDEEELTMNMLFKHCTANIQLNFETTSGNTITRIGAVTTQFPNTADCTLQMANGYISSSTSFGSGMFMFNNIPNSNSYYLDIMPFKPSASKILIKLSINLNNTYDIWYDAYYPVPSGGSFEGRVSYNYTLIVDPTKKTATARLVSSE